MNRPRREILKKIFKYGVIPPKNVVKFLLTDDQKVKQAFDNNRTTTPNNNGSGGGGSSGGSGGSGGSSASQTQLNKKLADFNNIVRQAAVRSPASFVGALQLRSEFQFETSPALQTMSRTMGDYTGIIANAMAESEKFVVDLTQQISTGVGVLVAGVAGLVALAKIGPAVILANLGRLVLPRLIPGRIAAAIGGVAARPLQFLGNLVKSAFEAIFFTQLPRILKPVVDFFTEGYQRKIFRNTLAGGMIRPNIAQEFARQTLSIPNYSVEEMQRLQRATVDYGSTNEQLYRVLQFISKSTPQVQNLNSFVSSIVNTANFFGVDESLISRTYSNIAAMSQVASENPKELQPVVEKFEKLYVSLFDTLNPSPVKLALVDSLASFAANYSFTKSIAADLDEIAKIQAFLSRTSIGDKLTTEVTRNLIRGVDDVFRQFGTFSNPQVASFMQAAGISRAEAIRGVTADADTYQAFVSELANRFGISEDGEMSDEEFGQLMFFLTQDSGREGGYGLGFSHENAQAIAESVRSYGAGNRIEPFSEVESFNIPNSESDNEKPFVLPLDASEGVSIAERARLDELYEPLQLLSGLSEGEFNLFDINVENVSIALDMTKNMNAAFADRMQKVLEEIAKQAGLTVKLVEQIKVDKPQQNDAEEQQQQTQQEQQQSQNQAAQSQAAQATELVMPTFDVPHSGRPKTEDKVPERDIMQQIYQTDALPSAGLITGVYDQVYKKGTPDEYKHKGIDADLGDGPEIYAAMSGIVVTANRNASVSTYGRYVVVKDDFDFFHYYAHLNDVYVNAGDEIASSQVLGTQGNTGLSFSVSGDGSHLHYEIRGPSNTIEERIDPVVYFELLEQVLKPPEWWEEDSLELISLHIPPEELEEIIQGGYTNKQVLHNLFNDLNSR